MKIILKRIRYSALILISLIGLVIGINALPVNAIVSTNYEIASPRISGVPYTGQAKIESSKATNEDGQYIVFSSDSANFVPNDTNNLTDIFVRDTKNNITSRINVSSTGLQANAYSRNASISHSGRYVVFESAADNLTSGVSGTSYTHIYMHDRVTSTTSLVDLSATGVLNNSYAYTPKISADGRFVVFAATGTNLTPGVSSSWYSQIYIKDMHNGAIKLLSVGPTGTIGNLSSTMPDISCDGSVVAFPSQSNNLGDANGGSGNFRLIVAHIGWSGVELNAGAPSANIGIGASYYNAPQVSCDGNKILFTSDSTNLVSPSTPSGYTNAYHYDRLSGNIVQVSLGNGGVQAGAQQQYKSINVSMSGDGRYVAFTNFANNMDTSYPDGVDTGSTGSVFIRDTKRSTTELVTKLPSGNRSSWIGSGNYGLSISGDGMSIFFAHVTAGTSSPERSLITGFNTGLTSNATDIYKTQTGH